MSSTIVLPPTSPLVGSGHNGDFLEVDIMRQIKGVMKVSLDLLPVGCVLRVYDDTQFVRFKRIAKEGSSDTIIICLHDYAGVIENPCLHGATNKKSRNTCGSSWILSSKRQFGGGANIQTLKYHLEVHYPKPKVDKVKPSVSTSQRTLVSWISAKPVKTATAPVAVGISEVATASQGSLAEHVDCFSENTMGSAMALSMMKPCYGVHFLKIPLPLRVSSLSLAVYSMMHEMLQ